MSITTSFGPIKAIKKCVYQVLLAIPLFPPRSYHSSIPTLKGYLSFFEHCIHKSLPYDLIQFLMPLNELDSDPSMIAARGQAPGSKSKFDELQDETVIIIMAKIVYFNIINFSQTLYQTIKKKCL